MKKIVIVLLTLSISLVGCNSTLNYVENSSLVKEQSSNLTNSSDISNISSNPLQTPQSSIPMVTTGPEPEYFSFYCESFEDFLLWSKTKGTVKVGLNSDADNPLNQKYLNWIKNKSSLLVPKLKEPLKTVYWVQPHEKLDGYFTMISIKEISSQTNDDMMIFIFGLNKELQNKDFDYVTENWVLSEVLSHKKVIINKGEYAFGKYYYYNSKESNQQNSAAWFIKDQYLIYMSAYSNSADFADDWQDEYFEYFDFETVSLN